MRKRMLKVLRGGLYFNEHHLEKHLGGDPVYKSQFTYKKFFNNEYVNSIIMKAFSKMKATPKEGRTHVHIAYRTDDGEKFFIGKSAANGGMQDKYSVLRVTFKYSEEDSTADREVWVNTSLYPVVRADSFALIIKIK